MRFEDWLIREGYTFKVRFSTETRKGSGRWYRNGRGANQSVLEALWQQWQQETNGGTARVCR